MIVAFPGCDMKKPIFVVSDCVWLIPACSGTETSKSIQILHVQSNLDYSKCQGPQESFRIIGSSNDRKREFLDFFGKARMLS